MKLNDFKSLPQLSFPIADLRMAKDEEGNIKVFDPLRKKFVVLTPEEWVRQNFVDWLIKEKGYPQSSIANEVEIKLNDTKKRCDSIIFGRECQPLIIIEYKAPDVEITQVTFDQIIRYNRELRAKYLIVSNGVKLYCCVIDYDNESYHFIPKIPDYAEANLPSIN